MPEKKQRLMTIGAIATAVVLALSLLAAPALSPGGSYAFAQQTDPTTTPTAGEGLFGPDETPTDEEGGGLFGPTATPTGEDEPTGVPETGLPAGVLAEFEDQLTDLYEQVSPSVVSISILGNAATAGFPQGGQGGDVVPLGAGSGVVWDEEGYIITNNHVVENAEQVVVDFSDGTSASAEVIGTDPASDLAVIQVDLPGAQLQPIQQGDMDEVQVGNLAIALGNPFGLQGSMSVGIVSALGRSLPASVGATSYTIPSVIQTDAPINPGNSGGALVNARGELIGVPSAIRSTTGSGSGVGFAIPISIVQRVVPALIETGEFQHPYLGITGTALTAGIAQAMDLEDGQTGALVIDVAPGGPADEAGLTGGTEEITINGQPVPVGGDVITAIDGEPVRSLTDLINYLTLNAEVGDTVTLTILRGGEEQEVEVTLVARPSVPQTGQPVPLPSPTQPGRVMLGVQVVPVTEDIIEQFDLPEGTQGLFVGALVPGYPADLAGVRAGDVITAFNGEAVTDITELRALLAELDPDDTAELTILREGETQELTVDFGQTSPLPTAEPDKDLTRTPTVEPTTEATLEPTDEAAPTPTVMPTREATAAPTTTPTPRSTPTAEMNDGQSLLGFRAVLVNSSTVANALNLPSATRGIYVASIVPGSIADLSDLQEGDVITAVNGEAANSLQDLAMLAQNALLGEPVELTVLRDGETIQLPLNLAP